MLFRINYCNILVGNISKWKNRNYKKKWRKKHGQIWRSTSRWTTRTFKMLLQQKYKFTQWLLQLTLSWRSLSCRNHSIDLFYKSVDWFLYDKHLLHGKIQTLSRWDQAVYIRETFFNVFNLILNGVLLESFPL